MTIDDVDCPFCWDTGTVTVMERDRNGDEHAITRPCPEGCPAPEEVPFR